MWAASMATSVPAAPIATIEALRKEGYPVRQEDLG